MKNMEMRLNDKGIVAIIVLVLVLTLSLGLFAGFSLRGKTDRPVEQYFTTEQANLIKELQAMEDEDGTGQKVYGTFDENGKFWIGWDSTGDHQFAREAEEKLAMQD